MHRPLVMTLPFSGAIFIRTFPRECTETLLEGHRRAFEDLGGVPRRIAERSAVNNADRLAYLLQLGELELIEREHNAAWRRVKAAHFPAPTLLDEFAFPACLSINQPLCRQLVNGDFLDRRENILLVGPCGTGKAHLAAALGMAACAQGHKVHFFTAVTQVNFLETKQQAYQIDRLLTQLDRTDLLIIDEPGYPSFSRGGGAELRFQVFAAANRPVNQMRSSNCRIGNNPASLLSGASNTSICTGFKPPNS